jgi:hypothetical protein
MLALTFINSPICFADNFFNFFIIFSVLSGKEIEEDSVITVCLSKFKDFAGDNINFMKFDLNQKYKIY